MLGNSVQMLKLMIEIRKKTNNTEFCCNITKKRKNLMTEKKGNK